MIQSISRGKRLFDTFWENLNAFKRGPAATLRQREVIVGVTAHGSFVGGMTVDGFIARASQILLESGRIYRFDDTLCYEVNDGAEQQLRVLASQHRAEPNAGSLLANLMCVGVQGDDAATQSLLPANLVSALLADQQLWRQLPRIRSYSRRPLFDEQFRLCGPGWNAGTGTLVHGLDVEPAMEAPAYSPDAGALDRLPPLLRRLFRGFCWASDADLTNAVAFLLTGLLSNHFVQDPKPVGIIDGNQKGLGKTLLIQAIGHLLDDTEPPRVPLVRDEELEKKLCALLREARSSIFFFDNVRDRVESALIEANSLAPQLSFRILGQSGTISRPNTFLWVITSNQASATEDLISRGLPIRLRYEGDPRQRTFDDNLLAYVRRERLPLLGELVGMVLRWKQNGMPRGAVKHRCGPWAEIVGGILQVAGLNEFLGNVEEAEAAMDEGLVGLTSLAEHVLNQARNELFCATGSDPQHKGKPAADWVPLFTEAEVCKDALAAKSPRGRATWVGTWLGAKIGRKVPVSTRQGTGRATLQVREERSRRKCYYFETLIDDDKDPGPQTPGASSRRQVPQPSDRPAPLPPSVQATKPAIPPVAHPPAGVDNETSVGGGLQWV
jgi:hypothetical protein